MSIIFRYTFGFFICLFSVANERALGSTDASCNYDFTKMVSYIQRTSYLKSYEFSVTEENGTQVEEEAKAVLGCRFGYHWPNENPQKPIPESSLYTVHCLDGVWNTTHSFDSCTNAFYQKLDLLFVNPDEKNSESAKNSNNSKEEDSQDMDLIGIGIYDQMVDPSQTRYLTINQTNITTLRIYLESPSGGISGPFFLPHPDDRSFDGVSMDLDACANQDPQFWLSDYYEWRAEGLERKHSGYYYLYFKEDPADGRKVREVYEYVYLDIIGPLDGGWGEWSDWSECHVTCGYATKTRRRTCTNPAPEYGGANCTGEWTQVTSCALYNKCPKDPEGLFSFGASTGEGGIEILWELVGNGLIKFQVSARTKGYIGIGISPTGTMLNADIVIGWVEDDGEAYLQDRHAVKNREEPIIDCSNDYELISGRENATHTVLIFERPITICKKQDEDITDGVMQIIYAIHSEDPSDLVNLPVHDQKGVKRMQFLDIVPTPSLPDQKFSFRFLTRNVQFPEGNNEVFWCQILKMPRLVDINNLNTKYHIIQYEPIKDSIQVSLVESITAYECSTEQNELLEDGMSLECKSFDLRKNCSAAFIFWPAHGEEEFIFPENVGFAIGGDHSPGFIMLEVHYQHPKLSEYEGNADGVGLQISYTDILREHDAGLLQVGAMRNKLMTIPPGSENFVVSGFCHVDCINEAIQEGGRSDLTVFAGLLHAHDAASGLAVNSYTVSNKDALFLKHFAFNHKFHQTMKLFKKETKIRPGDSVVLDCRYNTKDQDSVIYGGVDDHSEACYSFLYYYPKTHLETCQSSADPTALLQAATGSTDPFVVREADDGDFLVTAPSKYANQAYSQIIGNVRWTKERRENFERVRYHRSYQRHCSSHHEQKEPVTVKQTLNLSPPFEEQCIPN